MELKPILHVWINHDHDLVDLTITKPAHGKARKPTAEVIHTNKKHPFLTVEKGFLPVGQIKLDMHVVEADGHLGVISGWKVVPGVKTMYNLEVAQDHTFTVGVGQWVVHNCANSLANQAESRARELGNNVAAQVGDWSRSALTVGVANVDDGDLVRTLVTTNEKASGSLIKLVGSQLTDQEELVSLGDRQGRHAEQVLVDYAKDNGLKILGLGASNNFCGTCSSMLQQDVGQQFLGQP